MNGLIECIPNFSEGRNLDTINKLANIIKKNHGVMLLDYSYDYDHNRSVYTFVGKVETVEEVMFNLAKYAKDTIDLRSHQGIHPRMGAVDVIPFVALDNKLLDQTILMSKRLAKRIANDLNIPTYLYEKSAINSYHKNLQDLRSGQFEGLYEKQKDPKWHPDNGIGFNETAGVCAIGVRDPLIAYNIVLDNNDLDLAKRIASHLREANGGLPRLKALGLRLDSIQKVQISFNLCDYHKTGIMDVYNAVKEICIKQGINILYSELIGLMPLDSTKNVNFEEIKLKDFDLEKQVIENRIKNLERGKDEF